MPARKSPQEFAGKLKVGREGPPSSGDPESWESLLAQIPAAGFELLPPDPGGAVEALGNIGYTLQEALADLIDNCVDAGASNVLIRFLHDEDAVRRIVVADDGSGMSDQTLHSAMQIGQKRKHGPKDLGMYGTGLKTASLSQCDKFSVITVRDGHYAGRFWSVEEVKSTGWRCAQVPPEHCTKLLGLSWEPARIQTHGTLIVWDRIRKAYESKRGCQAALAILMPRVSLHLGMSFHRFIERERLNIRVEAQRIGETEPLRGLDVLAIDPFAYPQSGNGHYPKVFTVGVSDSHVLHAEAHVWPARSKAVEYKLGGQTASRQGFYFYRNDRLLQAGGWNRVRKYDSEPHLSLARVRIDIPGTLDELFRPVTQKNQLRVPDGFAEAVLNAKSGGVAWKDYERDALEAYKRRTEDGDTPILPGRGFSGSARRQAARTSGGESRRATKIGCTFKPLEAGTVFAIDRANKRILLNSRYKRQLEGTGGAGDLLKTLIFLLLKEEFEHERGAKKRDLRLSQFNQLLAAAL